MTRQTDEAGRIYAAIFKKEIPLELKERFAKAGKMLEARFSQQEIAEYYTYLERAADLEALELAGRLRGKLPLLSDKFKIMVFLAETRPENYRSFISDEDHVVKAYLWMPLIAVHSIWKLFKGLCQMALYRP